MGWVLGLLAAVVPALGSPGRPDPPARHRATTAAVDAPPTTAEPPCVPAPLEQRAAQVLVVGLPGVTGADHPLVADVLDVGVGGVLLTDANVTDAPQVRTLVDGLRAATDLPLLVAGDEEPGRVSSFGAVLGRSSSARTLAARGTPEQVGAFARQLGARLADLGVDLDLAPVVDVSDGAAAAIIGDRSFSGDPSVAARYALAFSRGLADAGVVPTAKHFPGHGRSAADSHRALGRVDATLAELTVTDLVPFVAQIAAGVPVVMVGHVAYDALDPGLPASLSPSSYQLLRELGFRGVAITDSLGMGAVNQRWGFAEATIMAVSAGADAVLATDGSQARAMRDALVDAVGSGRLDEARLDEAVARMLALKGLDPHPVVCRDAAIPQTLLPAARGQMPQRTDPLEPDPEP